MTAPRFPLTRRRFLASAAVAVPALAGGGMLLSSCAPRGGAGAVRAASPGFLDAIADMVIPRTGTPGAVDMNVGAYMARAFEHGLFGGSAATGGALEAVLDKRVPGGAFMKASSAERLKALTALDTETYSRPAPPPIATAVGGAGASAAQVGTTPPGTIAAPAEPNPDRLWRTAKNAVIVGYYMSEAGASRELRYELVPGRFDPDIPYKPGDTYLSNNWMANGA